MAAAQGQNGEVRMMDKEIKKALIDLIEKARVSREYDKALKIIEVLIAYERACSDDPPEGSTT